MRSLNKWREDEKDKITKLSAKYKVRGRIGLWPCAVCIKIFNRFWKGLFTKQYWKNNSRVCQIPAVAYFSFRYSVAVFAPKPHAVTKTQQFGFISNEIHRCTAANSRRHICRLVSLQTRLAPEVETGSPFLDATVCTKLQLPNTPLSDPNTQQYHKLHHVIMSRYINNVRTLCHTFTALTKTTVTPSSSSPQWNPPLFCNNKCRLEYSSCAEDTLHP